MQTKSRLLLGVILLAPIFNSLSQPFISRQPTNQSVSLGATASFLVTATSTNPPILFQWRFAMTNLLAATNSILTLTNVQITDLGDYDVVVADLSNTITSYAAHLEVDPTFTKITTADRMVSVKQTNQSSQVSSPVE